MQRDHLHAVLDQSAALDDAHYRQLILDQLDRIVQSEHFRNSKRYPAFLRFITEETLAGRSDSLKERTLGISVFGRSADYDTNADPVVRVSAGEVRKRIAQYYQSAEHTRELRFALPRGSYVPRFSQPGTSPPLEEDELPTAQGEAHSVVAEHPSFHDSGELPGMSNGLVSLDEPAGSADGVQGRARPINGWSRSVAAVAIVLLVGGILLSQRSLRQGIFPLSEVGSFWDRVLTSPEPSLIVLGVHSFSDDGIDISPLSHASLPQTQQTLLSSMTRSDMIALKDVISYGEITDLLARHAHAFRTQGAADTTLEQLRRGPVVLIGGFNNAWTKRFSMRLRYRLITVNDSINLIQDSEHPAMQWTLDTSQNALSNSRDFGIVSCFFDPEIEQYVVIAAGIGMNGTEAAAEYASNEKILRQWFKAAHLGNKNNVEFVIATDVIEGKHGPPHVIATETW